MSILDGLPDLIANALGDVFRDATLKIPGTPTSDGQGGWTPGAPTSKTCKALVEDYSDFRRHSLGIPANDRKIIMLAASIQDDATPEVGQTITAEGRDWQIVAVSRDPAAATYELQAR